MQSESFRVAGVSVQTFSLQSASSRICDDVSTGNAFSVFTLNLDHVVKLRRDKIFRTAYDRAHIVLPDGFPIVLAGRLQRRDVRRTTGSDIIDPLCAEAARRGIPVMLYGSTFETLTKAARHLKSRHGALNIAGVFAPRHGLDVHLAEARDGMDFIHNSGARICFVALGAPKQEIFADLCAQQFQGIAFICIGAGLDFLAGSQQRAPRIFQAAGLEWLWRMMSDPRRLTKRYLQCLYVFPGVLLEGLSRRFAAASA